MLWWTYKSAMFKEYRKLKFFDLKNYYKITVPKFCDVVLKDRHIDV